MGVPVKKRHFGVPIKAFTLGAFTGYVSYMTVSYLPGLKFNLFEHLLFVTIFSENRYRENHIHLTWAVGDENTHGPSH